VAVKRVLTPEREEEPCTWFGSEINPDIRDAEETVEGLTKSKGGT
jgi:hypothetical protein